MKKTFGLFIIAALLLSSCSSYTATGAYTGAQFGTILGSAIGGITGGWRGSDIGSIVGMAGGAAVGAAIGAAADKAQQEKIEGYHKRIEERERQGAYDRYQPNTDGYQDNDSGFDATNSGDDRITIDGMEGPKDGQGNANDNKTFNPATARINASNVPERIVIRNAHFHVQSEDGILRAGEQCEVSFEIMNYTRHTLYDVQPMVYDVTGNKHLHISPNLRVESIAPNSGVRYTATILADKKMKDGTAKIRVGATVNNQDIESNGHEFVIVTRKK